jgi:hypothetical protein
MLHRMAKWKGGHKLTIEEPYFSYLNMESGKLEAESHDTNMSSTTRGLTSRSGPGNSYFTNQLLLEKTSKDNVPLEADPNFDGPV